MVIVLTHLLHLSALAKKTDIWSVSLLVITYIGSIKLNTFLNFDTLREKLHFKHISPKNTCSQICLLITLFVKFYFFFFVFKRIAAIYELSWILWWSWFFNIFETVNVLNRTLYWNSLLIIFVERCIVLILIFTQMQHFFRILYFFKLYLFQNCLVFIALLFFIVIILNNQWNTVTFNENNTSII